MPHAIGAARCCAPSASTCALCCCARHRSLPPPNQVAADEEARRRLREEVILLRRDALKLLDYATETGLPLTTLPDQMDELRRALRRKLDLPGLTALKEQAQALLNRLRILLETPDTSANDSQNERHHQRSKKESFESEQREEHAAPTEAEPPDIPLHRVLRACPNVETFAQGRPRNWPQFIAAMERIHPMIGISPETWRGAVATMGAGPAAVTVAAMLHGLDRIKNPGGYLRTLARKAGQGAFSPVPMVMALLHAGEVDSCQLGAG